MLSISPGVKIFLYGQAADLRRGLVEDAARAEVATLDAEREGAVAAPTAGLHFDLPMLEDTLAAGVRHAFVTLHVGEGTFSPIRVDDVEAHLLPQLV